MHACVHAYACTSRTRELTTMTTTTTTTTTTASLILAAARGALGAHTEQVKAYERALSLRPEDMKGWTNLGVAHSMLGDDEQAEHVTGARDRST